MPFVKSVIREGEVLLPVLPRAPLLSYGFLLAVRND